MLFLNLLESCQMFPRQPKLSRRASALALVSWLTALSAAQAQGPVSSAFTYQGRLVEAGAPATGLFDLQFRLFTAPTTPPGVQVGPTQVFDNVSVTNGLFTISLDFGSQYNGNARWLDIGVHPGGEPVGNPYTLLTPRRELTGTPYALGIRLPLSESISSASAALSITNNGTGHAARFDGPDNNGTTAALSVGSGSQTLLLDGNEVDSLNPGGLFINNNTTGNVVVASGGGHVGVGNTAPDASLTVGDPGVLNVYVPGDSTCFTGHAAPGCSDPGCENLVCAVDPFCCSNSWDSVCVDLSNDLCIGRVGIGTTGPEARLHIAGGTDAALADGGFLVTGSIGGANLCIDNNEIMARNNGAAAALILNADGGNVGIGTLGPDLRLHVSDGGSGGSPHANAELLIEDDSSCYINLMAPDASEHGVSFGSPASAIHGGVYYTNAGGLNFRTGNNATRAVISANGNLAIGSTGSNDAALHVRNSAGASRPIKCDRIGSDGELLAWARDDSVVGAVTVTGSVVSYGAFTGSHWAWMPHPLDRGALVTMTGQNRRSAEDSEVIYGVAETTMPNDPACLGAYLAPLVVSELPGTTDQHQIMSVGNGELWVVDSGQDILPGDLLIASHVPGCAMKDDPVRFPVGHIVARAAESVRWSEGDAQLEGPRRARISVLFDRFTRSQDAAALSAMTRELSDLRERLERLEQEAAIARTRPVATLSVSMSRE